MIDRHRWGSVTEDGYRSCEIGEWSEWQRCVWGSHFDPNGGLEQQRYRVMHGERHCPAIPKRQVKKCGGLKIESLFGPSDSSCTSDCEYEGWKYEECMLDKETMLSYRKGRRQPLGGLDPTICDDVVTEELCRYLFMNSFKSSCRVLMLQVALYSRMQTCMTTSQNMSKVGYLPFFVSYSPSVAQAFLLRVLRVYSSALWRVSGGAALGP